MHTHQFTLQGFPLLCRAEPWQLQQPCGCDVAQQWGDGLVPSPELGQRLQHCVVGLAGAEALHAGPSRAQDVVESSDEMLDQRGLSDPGFASDPSQRAATCVGAFPGTLQDCDFGCAANKRGRRRNSERLAGKGTVLGCAIVGNCGLRNGPRDEPIPSARDRFDETRIPRIVPQRRADVADRAFQHGIADETMAPHDIEKGMLGQHRPGLSGERAQEFEWRRCERNRGTAAKQPHVPLIEFELAEPDMQGIWACRHCHYLSLIADPASHSHPRGHPGKAAHRRRAQSPTERRPIPDHRAVGSP